MDHIHRTEPIDRALVLLPFAYRESVFGVGDVLLQGRMVVILANLKARNMRGVKSHGMVLCASNDAHDVVEPLTPPEGAVVGERCWFGDNAEQAEPSAENKLQKKKYWETAQPDLKTSGDMVAQFKGANMMTSAGPIKATSLQNANIS